MHEVNREFSCERYYTLLRQYNVHVLVEVTFEENENTECILCVITAHQKAIIFYGFCFMVPYKNIKVEVEEEKVDAKQF